jgi:predicted metal-dependent peptidase
MMLNPHYFTPRISKHRVATLSQEILHITWQHLYRLFKDNMPQEEHRENNIAADMAINQYVPDAPDGCPQCPPFNQNTKDQKPCANAKCPGRWVHYHHFQLPDGKPFPARKTAEEYLTLIKESRKDEDNPKKPGNQHNKGILDGFGVGGSHDEHMYTDLSEEEHQKMLEEAKKMIKRTIEKTSRSHSSVPESIQDLLEKIEGELNNLDHKGILKRAIKKTISANDREGTWNKPNKRYGVFCPGSRSAKMPSILFLADTSGSISHKELNMFLDITDDFLRVGTKTCKLGLWHTDLYHVAKYKVGQRIGDDQVQSGGTDVGPALKYAKQTNPNLTIILTDGYFDACSEYPTGDVIWIISEGGNHNHPMSHVGKTIHLDKLIGKKAKAA